MSVRVQQSGHDPSIIDELDLKLAEEEPILVRPYISIFTERRQAAGELEHKQSDRKAFPEKE